VRALREKYLLTVIGTGVFKVLIPLACALFGVSLFCAPQKLRAWGRSWPSWVWRCTL
jgi:hypothetical protein